MVDVFAIRLCILEVLKLIKYSCDDNESYIQRRARSWSLHVHSRPNPSLPHYD